MVNPHKLKEESVALSTPEKLRLAAGLLEQGGDERLVSHIVVMAMDEIRRDVIGRGSRHDT